jgi:hypothetical protein
VPKRQNPSPTPVPHPGLLAHSRAIDVFAGHRGGAGRRTHKRRRRRPSAATARRESGRSRRRRRPKIITRRQGHSRQAARAPHYEKHLALPTFVTSRNSPVTKIGRPTPSAVARTRPAPTTSAEVRRLPINGISSRRIDLENHPAGRISSPNQRPCMSVSLEIRHFSTSPAAI